MFRRGLLNFALVLAGLGLALAFGELLLRWTGAAPEVVYIEKWRMRLARNPKIGFEPIPNLDSADKSIQFYGYQGLSNSMGFRDVDHALEKQPGTRRVIVLGDSIPAGLWIDDEADLFPSVVQEHLRKGGVSVDVMNFGVLGYNTEQEVETLREKGLQFDPDLVILSYCLNDRYRDDGHVYSHLLAEERKQSQLNVVRVHPWIARSASLRFLNYRLLPYLRSDSPDEADEAGSDPDRFDRDTVEEYFGELAELSQRHGFEVMVVVFPDLEGVDKRDPKYAFRAEHESVASLSEKNGFAHLDLLDTFRRCKQAKPRRRISFDRFHPRPEGNHCAGAAIADYIQEATWPVQTVAGEPAQVPEYPYQFVDAFPDLKFRKPTHLVTTPGRTGRFFVIEQSGRVHWFDPRARPASSRTALDISERVARRGWEEGLLGLVFHPGFEQNRQLFLFYTRKDPPRNVLSRFLFDEETESIDAGSEQTLLEVPKERAIHNGGSLQFGPDGYLYVSIGDGGPVLRPDANPQSLDDLYGKILRIDVDRVDAGRPYAIPADNPFVGQSGAQAEIWAYGLRNVWRFSFDPRTGILWAADVGYYRVDEVDIVEKGKNYGWPLMEGSFKYLKPPKGFDLESLVLPITEHKQEDARSLVGGHVYRGKRFPDLVGAYVYGDFITGKFWALFSDGGEIWKHIQIAQAPPEGVKISSIAVDPRGELYFTSLEDGAIYELERAGPAAGASTRGAGAGSRAQSRRDPPSGSRPSGAAGSRSSEPAA